MDHAQIFNLVNLTGRKSGQQHAQMQDGEGSHRGRKRVCVETFARGELAPFHSVVIEHLVTKGRYLSGVPFVHLFMCAMP